MSANPLAFDVRDALPGGPRLIEAIDAAPVEPKALDVVSFVVHQPVVVPAFLLDNDGVDGSAASVVSDLAADLGGQAFALSEGVFALLHPAEAHQSAVLGCLDVMLAPSAATFMHVRVTLPSDAHNGRAALRLAYDRLVARASYHWASPGRQVRDVLLQLLKERGNAGHTVRRPAVLADAVTVGRRLGLSPEQLEHLARAAELQDLGLLLQPSVVTKHTFTSSDRDDIRRHPLVAERVLNAAPSLAPVARIVRGCYERFDGTGYPEGLRGVEIPLGARIIAVCVAFDAMTSRRPYRAALPPRLALDELRSCAGHQFDPEVVELFANVISQRDG